MVRGSEPWLDDLLDFIREALENGYTVNEVLERATSLLDTIDPGWRDRIEEQDVLRQIQVANLARTYPRPEH